MGHETEPHDFLEFFAGDCEVSKAILEEGLNVVAYDIRFDGVFMDILSDLGFLNALLMALFTSWGASSFLAIVCSTWINLNVGTSGRSQATPLGNQFYPSVAQGNKMVSRCVILLFILHALGNAFFSNSPEAV